MSEPRPDTGCCEEKKQPPRGGHPRFHEILRRQGELHDRKNTDYAAGGKQGPLGNFVRVSEIKRLYPGFDWSSAFGTAIDYMLKQLDAAFILYATGRKSITGEPIPARLMDVAVYANIAQIIYEEEVDFANSLIAQQLAEQLELPFKAAPFPEGWANK